MYVYYIFVSMYRKSSMCALDAFWVCYALWKCTHVTFWGDRSVFRRAISILALWLKTTTSDIIVFTWQIYASLSNDDNEILRQRTILLCTVFKPVCRCFKRQKLSVWTTPPRRGKFKYRSPKDRSYLETPQPFW